MEITGHITRRRALAGAGVLVAVLALGGKLLLGAGAAQSSRDPGAPSAVQAAAAAERPGRTSPSVGGAAATGAGDLVVHVVGAVRRPGVYRLAQGARAADAVARAGGASGAADLEAIDLAAPVADGQQVVVPRRGQAGAGPAPTPSPSGAGPAARMGPVHLNTATAADLDALPGIGPSTAQKIVDYRSAHGPFHSVDELDAIPGIGMAKIDQLRDLVAP